MTWICLDRFQEFETHRALLRVLVQKLDPQDPISPWHKSALSIRQQSVALFDKLVARSITNLDAKTRRQLARALWLQHLLILGIWSFDRTPNEEETNAIMRQSIRLWKNLPTLVNVPGMKTLFNLVLSPLERFEGKP